MRALVAVRLAANSPRSFRQTGGEGGAPGWLWSSQSSLLFSAWQSSASYWAGSLPLPLRSGPVRVNNDFTACWQELEKIKHTVQTLEREERVEKQQLDICLLPAAPGPCTTLSLQRWFYHQSSGQCRQFSWGGCQGNNNNFHTLRQCEAACRQHQHHLQEEQEQKEEEEEEPDCSQPPDSGPCRGELERFYWEAGQQECLVFSYSGCAGNNNNFLSLEECQTHCRPARRHLARKTENLCFLESDGGPCSSYQTRSVLSSEISGEVERWRILSFMLADGSGPASQPRASSLTGEGVAATITTFSLAPSVRRNVKLKERNKGTARNTPRLGPAWRIILRRKLTRSVPWKSHPGTVLAWRSDIIMTLRQRTASLSTTRAARQTRITSRL